MIELFDTSGDFDRFEIELERKRLAKEHSLALKHDLIPVVDPKIGDVIKWFYSGNKKIKTLRIASKLIAGQGYRIDHVLPNGEFKPGGFVRAEEMYILNTK